jgi:hypothetical protein
LPSEGACTRASDVHRAGTLAEGACEIEIDMLKNRWGSRITMSLRTVASAPIRSTATVRSRSSHSN